MVGGGALCLLDYSIEGLQWHLPIVIAGMVVAQRFTHKTLPDVHLGTHCPQVLTCPVLLPLHQPTPTCQGCRAPHPSAYSWQEHQVSSSKGSWLQLQLGMVLNHLTVWQCQPSMG
jgi:hypothetical protein